MITAADSLQQALALTPTQFVGIPIAIVGAVFLSVGAQLQHRGVSKVDAATGGARGGLSVRQLGLLLRRPSWAVGTGMLGLAVVLQLVSLVFSPLIVVQPLGAVALVSTAILNARISRIRLGRQAIVAICACVLGVGVFVVVAAFAARDVALATSQVVVVLVVLAALLVLFTIVFVVWRRRMKAIGYILGAGMVYGFVATLAKVIISRIKTGDYDWLMLICLVGVVVATAGGAYLVQNAYSSGPPDLVIAGLTVVDPLVAVTIGIAILGEASEATSGAMVLFLLSGAVAVWGVFRLAKYHPQSH